jgi:hypothetical protein
MMASWRGGAVGVCLGFVVCAAAMMLRPSPAPPRPPQVVVNRFDETFAAVREDR